MQTVTAVRPTLAQIMFSRPTSLTLTLSTLKIILHLRLTVTIPEALLRGDRAGENDEIKELLTETKRKKRVEENDHVSVKSRPLIEFQEGPAKLKELTACRDPASAAVL